MVFLTTFLALAHMRDATQLMGRGRGGDDDVLGALARSTCGSNFRQRKIMLRMFNRMYGHRLGVTTRQAKAFSRPWERCTEKSSRNTTPHEPQQNKQLKTNGPGVLEMRGRQS